MAVPRILCINLERSKERKQRMTQRLKNLNLEFSFITAFDCLNEIADPNNLLHQSWKPLFMQYKTSKTYAAEKCCLLSHLKAIKTFLDMNIEESIIIEDDVCFRKNFVDEFQELYTNIPQTQGIVLLGHMVDVFNSEVCEWAGREIERYNLLKIKEQHLWGAQAYLIRRDNALEVLKRFRSQSEKESDYILSESIFRIPETLVAYPPLCIEECLDTNIQSDIELERHKKVFDRWGRSNYYE